MADETPTTEIPVGWIDPERFAETWMKAMAYRRQLIANGIKPDLETYRREVVTDEV